MRWVSLTLLWLFIVNLLVCAFKCFRVWICHCKRFARWNNLLRFWWCWLKGCHKNSNKVFPLRLNIFILFSLVMIQQVSLSYSISMKPSPVKWAMSFVVPSWTTKLNPTRQFFRTDPFFTIAFSQIIQFSSTTLKLWITKIIKILSEIAKTELLTVPQS